MMKKFVLVMEKLMLLAILLAIVMTASFSVSDCFNVWIGDQKSISDSTGHDKNQALNRRFLMEKVEFTGSKGSTIHVHHYFQAVMLHPVPSSPNPIQNNYPNNGHH
ncbi:hypothetical protein SUGI_0194400 [Cryptomeria japonica]|nr:hypothetical protein SUGI_0194400 [Cryptomeria japonica]